MTLTEFMAQTKMVVEVVSLGAPKEITDGLTKYSAYIYFKDRGRTSGSSFLVSLPGNVDPTPQAVLKALSKEAGAVSALVKLLTEDTLRDLEWNSEKYALWCNGNNYPLAAWTFELYTRSVYKTIRLYSFMGDAFGPFLFAHYLN